MLVANCCLSPICFNCSLELADHYSETGPARKCVFCSVNLDKRYLIRDPTESEQKSLIQKCKETMKMLQDKKYTNNNVSKR